MVSISFTLWPKKKKWLQPKAAKVDKLLPPLPATIDSVDTSVKIWETLEMHGWKLLPPLPATRDSVDASVKESETLEIRKVLPPLPATGDSVDASVKESEPLEIHDTTAATLTPPPLLLNNWKKSTTTLILVGETGVGKTAFLSLLANVCASRGLGDFQLEHKARNESGLSRDQSQTNEAMLYTFKHGDGKLLRVLDTPGLSDTRGINQDIQHRESIVKAIQGDIETVDGVLFMANGTLERAGPGIEYALQILSAIFPRTMAKNIGLLFTNVPDVLSFNFQLDTLPACIANSEVWTIQNPLAQVMRFREMVSGKAKQSEKQVLTFRKLLYDNYSATADTLNDMFTYFSEREAQKTQGILELHAMSQKLDLAVGKVVFQISVRDTAQAEITRLHTELIRLNQTLEVNREHSTTLSRQSWQQTSTYSINVLCTQKDCFQNCEIGCSGTFSFNPEEIRKSSSAFGWGRDYSCRACYHSYRDHRHFKTKWIQKSDTKNKTDYRAKSRFNAAQSQVSTNSSQKYLAQENLQESEKELEGLEGELRDLCAHFRGLSLVGSFTDHLVSTVRLLEVRLSTMQSGGADATASKQMEASVDMTKKRLRIVKAAEGL